ncbi:DUF4882 family protein [Acinetobacter baylyi]|uniref:DUF4882 family protein n=1 Tax=Acinetobacter baylyi TaxID=202950 RepID=UPI0031D4E0CD
MKKILIALTFSLSSLQLYAGTCTYTMDATQAQLDQLDTNYTKFPTIDLANQKATVTLPQNLNSQSNLQYAATSSVAASSQLGNTTPLIDKPVVANGIVATEYEFDVNSLKNNLGSEESIIVGFYMIGFSNNKGVVTAILKFGKANSESLSEPQIQSTEIMAFYNRANSDPVAHYKYYQTPIPTNGKIRIGTYINQSSKQLGYIFNGVNYGYLSNTLEEPVQSVSFIAIVLPYPGTNTVLAGKMLSAKLITNKSQMIFTYPTGTTDICGNAS